MKNLTLLLLVLGLLSACSKSPQTSARFDVTISGIAASSYVTGGMIITGKSDTGKVFSKIVSSGDAISADLPNGLWNFLAISWEGPTQMAGKPRCGVSKAVKLDGSAAAVSLNISNANCFNSSIGDNDYDSGSPTLFERADVSFCNREITSLAPGYNCTLSTNSATSEAQAIGSFKLILRDLQGVELAPSGCYANNGSPATSQRWPIVDTTQFHFPSMVRTYPDPNCTDANGYLDITTVNGKSRFDQISATDYMSVLVQVSNDDVCSMAKYNSPTSVDAYGQGTTTAPFGICNADQLYHWSNNASSLSSFSFILLKDINLLPGVATGGRQFTLNGQVYGGNGMSSCLKSGDTLVPIGSGYDGSCNSTATISFTGKLHGQGYTISHFRFKDKSKNDVGFIAKIAGSSAIAYVNFENAEVEGNNYVSVVTTGNTTGTVKNIKIKNARVEGNSWVASVVANTSVGSSSIEVSNAKITGKAYVGGVFGVANGGSFSDIQFSGLVANEGSRTGGFAANSPASNLTNILINAIVTGNDMVGGFIGESAASAATLSFSRFTGTVKSRLTDSSSRYLGGFIGKHTGSGYTIDQSIFDGNMVYDCTGPGANCYTGNIMGQAGGIITKTYIVMNEPHTALTTFGGENIAATPLTAANLCPSANCTYWFIKGGGQHARHAIETGVCATGDGANTLATQTGRGTATAPYLICSTAQLQEINNAPSAYYQLQENVHVGRTTPLLTSSFSGTLDGNGKILGGGLHIGAGVAAPLFTTIAAGGVVKNLDYVSGVISNSAASSLGAIAGTNGGTIRNVAVNDVYLIGLNNIGLVVGNNSSLLENVRSEGDIRASTSVGGIAGASSGNIIRASSRARLSPLDTANMSNVGGIVGSSTGNVKRVRFGGNLEYGSCTYSITKIGGIAGYLSTGLMEDVQVEASGRIAAKAGATQVGGLLGQFNGGTFRRAHMGGTLVHGDGTSATNSAPTVGQVVAGTSTSLYHDGPMVGVSPSYALNASVTYSTGATCDVSLTATAASGLRAVLLPEVGWYSFNLVSGTPYSGTVAVNDIKLCTIVSQGTQAYGDFGVLNNYSSGIPTDMVTSGFPIKRNNNVTEWDVVYNYYLNYLTGNPMAEINWPVWTYEDGRLEILAEH